MTTQYKKQLKGINQIKPSMFYCIHLSQAICTLWRLKKNLINIIKQQNNCQYKLYIKSYLETQNVGFVFTLYKLHCQKAI